MTGVKDCTKPFNQKKKIVSLFFIISKYDFLIERFYKKKLLRTLYKNEAVAKSQFGLTDKYVYWRRKQEYEIHIYYECKITFDFFVK